MISITSLIGLMLLIALIVVGWRMRPACKAESGHALEDIRDSSGQSDTPDAHAWCAALEEICQGAVFCFDESLRLKAYGNRARSMFTNSQAELHLVDIAPSSITSDLLEMMALARRKTVTSKDVLWDKKTTSACAAPVGKSWIALSIKNAALVVILLFACVACSSTAIDHEHSKEQAHAVERSVDERLADELIRHGHLLLRSSRFLDAMNSAELAAFLTDNPQSLEFVSECKKILAHEIAITKSLAADAVDAGDFNESKRLKNIVEAMDQYLEAR